LHGEIASRDHSNTFHGTPHVCDAFDSGQTIVCGQNHAAARGLGKPRRGPPVARGSSENRRAPTDCFAASTRTTTTSS